MDLTAGYPFSLINDGLLFQYPKLAENTEREVAIIGGGISGALMAYYLTEAGIPCVVVDCRTIGLGSTCASTSLLQYELDTPLHQLMEKVGRQQAIRAYQLCGEAIDKLEKIIQQTGYTEFESSPSLFYSTHRGERKFMERELAARKEAGFSIQPLSKDEMKTEYGLVARYGLLSEKGASINAYTLTHHLLQYSMKKGLKVFDRTRITSIEEKGEGVILTTAEGHTIKAAYAINATGYGVVDFIDKKVVSFDCTYAIISEHQAEREELWKDRVLMWSTDSPYLYIRLTKDNRIITGGRDEPASNRVTRELFLKKKASMLEKDFNKALPGIPFIKEFEWSGTFGTTKDSLPYIGPYKKTPRVMYALGFGGNGITFSQIAAEIVRDLLKGNKNPDADLFSFNR